ncbi:hypothetical protein D910_12251 [Dendroctonus ponderosae]|uniref:Tc1-like transposase DDE domain-containing protein n=1 Tax=Dendroctonus ponderosae TaxID=77166 RepID=U4ULM8_DENPD|nr:hypothetical protein D910_12251 [Dendroctonus ponderosae]
MFLQQDGYPAYFSVNVRRFLDNAYRDRWIGRGSLFPWPARSPDLTCMDFYLWGRVKENVLQTRPTSKQHLINKIKDEIKDSSHSCRRSREYCFTYDRQA